MYEETRVYTTTTGARWAPTDTYVASSNLSLWLDCGYLRTLAGLLKLIVIILNFLCFFCLLFGPAYYTGVGGATFVSVFGFIISLTLLMLYLFHVVDSMPQIPWIPCEMVYCFAWAIFYFIAGSVLAVGSVSHYHATSWAIAAFFGFSAMLVYILDAYLKFMGWKHNEVASGGCGSSPFIREARTQNY